MESSQANPTHQSSQGSIRKFIDNLLSTYAKDDELIRSVVICRLRLQGIHPSKYTSDSPDEHTILDKLVKIDQDLAKIFA